MLADFVTFYFKREIKCVSKKFGTKFVQLRGGKPRIKALKLNYK